MLKLISNSIHQACGVLPLRKEQLHAMLAFKDRSPQQIGEDMHLHQSWELKLLLQGRVTFRAPEPRNEIALKAPSLILIDPLTMHATDAGSLPTKAKILSFCIDEGVTYLNYIYNNKSSGRYSLGERQCLFIEDLLTGGVEREFGVWRRLILEKVDDVGLRILNSRILTFLLILLKTLLLENEDDTDRLLGHRERAMLYIRERYHDPSLTVAEIADHLGISTRRLAVVFGQDDGLGARRSLMQYRLNRARQLLMEKQYSIQEVSALTGWSNAFYFSRCFHKSFGHPPSEHATLNSQEMVWERKG